MKGGWQMASDGAGRRGTARLNGGGSRVESTAAGDTHAAEERPAAEVPAFEEALGQLEEAVQLLEGGQLPLSDALALFERGSRLAQQCQDLLDQAELRVRRLVKTETEPGTFTVETVEIDIE
jgi:exodeoxyribonuclease VII small subunit